MYVRIKSGFVGFEWDEGNIDKSYKKHGVSPKEAEEVFVDEGSIVLPDVAHSEKEERFIIVGKTLENVHMLVVFTFRNKKIRVISARKMHRKEVLRYAKYE